MDHAERFTSWARLHKKQYSLEEQQSRFETWRQNVAKIEAHNAEARLGLHTYTMAVNQFADMNATEFKSLRGRIPRSNAVSSEALATFRGTQGAEVPSEWDWRPTGIVTNVKNQASCGQLTISSPVWR